MTAIQATDAQASPAPAPAPAPDATHLAELLRDHRRRAEILVSLIQLAIVLLFGTLYFAAPMTFVMGETGVAPVPVALAAYLVLCLLRLWLARRDRLTPALLHASVVADMAVLFGLIWSFHIQYHQPPAFYLKAPTLIYVFIFIALRTLRLEPRYVVAAGISAIVGWMALAAYAVMADPVHPITRDYVAYMTGAKVLIGAEIDKIVAIAAVTAILTVAVTRGQQILLRQIESGEENARLFAESRALNHRLRDEIAEKEAAQTALRRAAYVDTLTGLGSRLWLLDRLAEATSAVTAAAAGGATSAKTGGVPGGGTLVLMDIDNFGAINSSLGQQAGDTLLRAVAERLTALAPAGAPVARIGADTFAALLPADSAIGPEELLRRLSEDYVTADREFAVSFSAGTAMLPMGCDLDRAMRDADTALHQAKEGGRGRILAFDPAEHDRVAARARLAAGLRHALSGRQLALFYQPIVNLEDGRVAGFEALIRWRHPEQGFVSPAQFIPIAEETGQIVEIGAWALDEATAALGRLQAAAGAGAPPLFMSVNVSARQFARVDVLTEAVRRAVDRAGGPLKLEVTESLLIDDVERANAILLRLAELGASLSMDDFGTGYSSLSQLHRLPFSTLKIDRSFTMGLDAAGPGGGTRPLVEATLGLARQLGLDVVAEGVETPAQRNALAELGCALGQGYLFSKPLPEAELLNGAPAKGG